MNTEHMIIININNIQSIGSITASHLIQLLVSARQNARILVTNDERRTTYDEYELIRNHGLLLCALYNRCVLSAMILNSAHYWKLKKK